MKRIGILGDIGSGKSYVANNFGYPVFNADSEVSKIYEKNKKIFNKLKKKLPRYISKFPIDKNEVSVAILSNKNNLKKIINIVHLEVRKQMKLFLKKNKNKKIVILDIPLLLENKINKKKDILIFVDSKKRDIEKKLIRRKNFNRRLIKKFKTIQFSSKYKKRKSNFIIKNNFTKKNIKKDIKNILRKIL
ncbi:dephospho-CoA kinase [Candidatus Pelagibacter sp.]|nr:dephospho-CoA kinase [Candidatus Pelagibacter sp.]